MSVPTRLVSKAEWDAARRPLLVKEKELMLAGGRS
jgi:predicted dithiol-disulfide oxidoreductase (DUF899 family)